MFERYSEAARRTIFFAHYEASQLHTGRIEPVHLLLGLFREDSLLRSLLPSPARDKIRAHIEQNFMGTEKVSTSVDLPLTDECTLVLDRAKEEADNMASRPIESGHLLLGLLRMAGSPVEELLRQHVISYESVRDAMVKHAPRPKLMEPPPTIEPRPADYLEQIPESASGQRLKRLPWTRKEALGHLIDWATAHHQWIGRALVEKKVVVHGYPTEERVAAQQYSDMQWVDLVIAWLALNDLVSEIVARIPLDKLMTPCRIGIEPEVPLAKVIEYYREHTNDILAQICARGD